MLTASGRITDDPRKLLAWSDRLKAERVNVENRWQEIADHELGRQLITRTTTSYEDRKALIYDTTAMTSNQQLQGGLYGLLTSPAGDWIDLMPGDPTLIDDEDARTWLELAKRTCLRLLQTQATNFATQAAEVYGDLPGFGMAALSAYPRDRRLVFCSHPLREIFIEQNADREVDIVLRIFPLTARQWARYFPDDTSKAIQEALDKTPEKQFEVRHLICPSDDPYAGSSAFRKPWMSIYFAQTDEHARIVKREGYSYNPTMTPRWEVDTGETYGRGPGWTALPPAKELNVMVRTIIAAGEKAVNPPTLVTNKAVLGDGRLRLEPGGLTYVAELLGKGGQPEPIRYLESRANHGLTVELLNRIQQQVRNAYFAQQFQFFDDPRMSATQVLELSKQVQMQMAPLLGRTMTELVDPIARKTFQLAEVLRYLPPRPAALRGQVILPIYTSPVVRAQRQTEAQAVANVWQGAGLIAQLSGDKGALAALDAAESVRVIHRATGAPLSILRSQRQVAAAQQAEQQNQQGERALAQMGAGADIVQKLSSALSESQAAQAA